MLAKSSRLGAAVAIFLCGLCLCQSVSAKTKLTSYRYVRYETTGLTQSIQDQGRTVMIQFHPESNPQARLSLLGLDTGVVTYAKNVIRVEGVLLPNVQWTPSCPQCPTSEPYQEFKLSGWSIQTPFIQVAYMRPEDLPMSPVLLPHQHLKPELFNFMDLSSREQTMMRKYVSSQVRSLEHAKRH